MLMLGFPGTFRLFHKLTSHEVSGPVFGQATVFISSRSDDSNKRKNIGCSRCVGDGHFNAGSSGYWLALKKFTPSRARPETRTISFPKERFRMQPTVSVRRR